MKVDDAGLVGVACPASSLCVAIDSAGRLLVSNKPSLQRGQWRQLTATSPAVGLTGVACPTVRLCVAVNGAGDVIVSDSPRTSRSWSVSYVDKSPDFGLDGGPVLTGVSCPTSSLCVAVDYDGNAVISTDPAAAASTWALHAVDDGIDYECEHYGVSGPACTPGLVAVSCASVTRCAAIDWAGGFLATDDPTTAVPWGGGEEPASESFDAIACPSTRVCLIGALYADQARGNAIQPATIVDPAGAINGIWCHSTHMCFATRLRYRKPSLLFESLNPTAARPAWKQEHAGPAITAVSCPTARLCFAATADGNVLVGTPHTPRHR